MTSGGELANARRPREGDWIATYSGGQWWITDARAEDVRLIDIAHALGNICRFGGQCDEFYSVAQHAVLVSRVLELWQPDNVPLQLWGLHHDDTEAYLGDLVRPLKRQLPLYRALENHAEHVIAAALDLPEISDEDRCTLKRADDALLMTERRDLVNHSERSWSQSHEEPLSDRITPWHSSSARLLFLARHRELAGRAGLQPLNGALVGTPGAQPVERVVA